MNSVKIQLLLTYKVLFFSNFSIVQWHWKIKKNFGPPKKKLKWRPCHSSQVKKFKLHTNVNFSSGQVVEGFTILPYPKGVRNNGWITQKT